MSNTRSRTQNITSKLVSLDSVPSNWAKRYNFLLLSPNALSGDHFVEHIEQIEQLHGQKLKILLGNPAYWIQHPQIMLKCLVPKLYSKMPLISSFLEISARLTVSHALLTSSQKTGRAGHMHAGGCRSSPTSINHHVKFLFFT